MERVACYVRVSTEEQRMHGISLDAQRDVLKRYCDENNLTIFDWYCDEGVSGRKLIKNRPELQRMIIDGENKKFTRILFIKLDRFFRSVAEYHECMKRLGNITWTSTEEVYDLTTANGRMMVNMKLTIAELEADQTAERIKLVNEYKVREGKALVGSGSLPLGFKVEDKKIVLSDDAAKAKEILKYFLTVQTIGQTAHWANEKYGISYWRTSTLIHSTLIGGIYRENKNYCESLLDEADYNKVRSLLAKKQRWSGERAKNVYLFQGVIRCPQCKRNLNGYVTCENVKGKRFTYLAYRCPEHTQTGKCGWKKSIYENTALKLVMNELDHVPSEPIELQLKEKESNKKSLQAELERLNYAFQKGRISVEIYDKEYERLTNEINSPIEPKNDLITLPNGWREGYELLDKQHKNLFFRKVFEYIEIDGEGREKFIVYK